MASRLDERSDSIGSHYEENQGTYDKEFKKIQQAEEDAAFKDIVDNYGQTADEPPRGKNRPSSAIDDRAGDVRNKEANPDSTWRNSTTPANQSLRARSGRFKKLFRSKKSIAASAGLGGILAVGIGLILMTSVGLRLEMFISNITKEASKVPAYATEQRLQYLVTRAIATRILMMSDANVNGELVFCKSGAVACSLFRTYTTNFIENKFDLKFNRISNGVELRVIPNGRSSLGGKAYNWKFEATRAGTNDEKLTKIYKEISSNAEMKRYITNVVNTKMYSNGYMTRFLARKILMRKYGVTHFRAFENTRASINDKKTTIRSKMISNTVGKVSPRMGLYLACLQQTDTCAKTLKELSPSSLDLEKLRQDVANATTPEEKARAEQALKRAESSIEQLKKIGGESLGDGATDASGDGLKRFLSKKILINIGGAAAVAGVLDMIFGAVGSIEEGGLDEIAQDMAKTAYIGAAYGDETGFVVNNDKLKAGDQDLEGFGVIDSMLDDAQKSPLMQLENGITTSAPSGGQFTSECYTDEGYGTVLLEPGESVCPNQKIVRHYRDIFAAAPGWSSIVTIATAWNESIGRIIDLLGGAISAIISIVPGVNALVNLAASAATPLLEWLLSTVFDPPFVGPDSSGSENYVGLSGGIRTSQNDTMQLGVDENGKALGGGGSVLTDEQLAMISNYTNNQDLENQSQRSVLAQMFDINQRGSLAQQAVLSIPTNLESVLGSLFRNPLATTSSVFFGGKANAASSTALLNPFGMPIYGYTDNAIFEADPAKYTEEECSILAAEREESYSIVKDSKYPVAVYQKSDPCALEKMVVGTALADAGVTDDEYSLENLDENASSNSSDIPDVNGSDQEIAKKIVANKNIVFESKYKYQIDNYAKGDFSCYIDSSILKLIATLGETRSLRISSLNRLCTRTLTGSGTGSLHYAGKGGRAVDFSMIDGAAATGGRPIDIKTYQDALAILPDKKLQLGQVNCRSSGAVSIPSGNPSIEVNDSCNHVHIGVYP